MNRNRAPVLLAAAAVLTALSGCAPSGPITPTVTQAGVDPDRPDYLLATGRVTGVSETGGTCSFTFWADTGVATRLTSEGRAVGDHTECVPVGEPLGFMVGVNYEVVLKYVALSGESVQSERVPMVLPRPSGSQ